MSDVVEHLQKRYLNFIRRDAEAAILIDEGRELLNQTRIAGQQVADPLMRDFLLQISRDTGEGVYATSEQKSQ